MFVESGSLVLDAAKLIDENNIGAVLVLSKDGKFLGIFSERDLLKIQSP